MSKLKELRERNNISKVDMCKILCMSENAYSKKEYNVRDMKFKDVMRICNFFKCSIEDIYDYDEKNESSKLKSLYICKNKIEFKSYIYFLKDINRGIIKIGKTSHLYFRISLIRSSMITAGINVEGLKLIGIYPTISQDVDLVEKEFHFRFKDKRVLGEWFKINEADIELKKITKVLGVSIFIGETIDIDKHVTHFIEKIEKRFVKNSEKSLSKGFISASLLVCIGSMTIVGFMNAGLSGDNSMLYTKSMLDLCSSMIFASTLGLGVFLASFFVLGYQGLLTLIAMWAAPVFTTHVINEMTCVGSLIIVATGFNLLVITDLKLMNFVPAMFLPILFCMFM